MKPRLAHHLALGLAALAFVACSQLGGLSDALAPYTPKVQFRDLALRGLDFSKIDVDFVFAIDNPNALEVKLDRFSYDLGLEGVRVVQGVNDAGITLAPKGSTEFKLPVSLRFADIFKLVGEVKGKDRLAFSLAGDFGFNTPLGVVTVPFEERGDFPVVHPPKIALAGLRMGDLNLLSQTATLHLDLSVRNDEGGAPLTLSGLDYRVSIGPARVAAGVVEAIPPVAPGAAQTVSIPLHLDLRALGGTIVTAVTSKRALDVDFAGTVQVGTPFGVIPLDVAELAKLDIL